MAASKAPGQDSEKHTGYRRIRPKLKLVPRSQPTGEKKTQNGPLKEPGSIDSAKEAALGLRLFEAAQTRKLQIHTYDILEDDQLRILIVRPADHPSADIIVKLETLTFNDLKEQYEFEALSYHVG
jgi:hypothetical protein